MTSFAAMCIGASKAFPSHMRTEVRYHSSTNCMRAVVSDGLEVETVTPADDDVKAVYRYLIEGEEG